jgi:lipoate-protein ligase A
MPVLVRSVVEQGTPIAQTSIWGKTHVNVGWFEDIDATIDLAKCRELGVEVVRRQVYGGGTEFYDEGCAVVWGFLLPKGDDDLDTLLARFQPLISDALSRIGLGEVQLEGSGDLCWHGRKLGALAAQDIVVCDSVGGFLYLREPDRDTYLQVVRLPAETFEDEAAQNPREFVCSAEEVVGHPVSYEDFRDAFIAALAEGGIEFWASELNEGERKALGKIADRVGSDDFLRRVSSERFVEAAPDGSRVGFANERGRNLCRAGVALDDGGTVVATMMAGDMNVSPPDTMDRIAEALVGADSTNGDELRARIASVLEGDDVRQAHRSMGVTTDDLLAAVQKAVAAAI